MIFLFVVATFTFIYSSSDLERKFFLVCLQEDLREEHWKVRIGDMNGEGWER